MADYVARFNRVMDYIEEHLASALSLEELAGVANFSPFHFHRLFQSYQGETLFRFISRRRIEQAAAMLRLHPASSVTSIAMDCGFENASAFSRRFRSHFGCSPREWRERGDVILREERNTGTPMTGKAAMRLEGGRQLWELRRENGEPWSIRIEEIEEIELAYIRHTGPYAANAALFKRLTERLLAWAGPAGVLDFPRHLYFLYPDTPDITPDEKLRVSACIPIPPDTELSGEVGRLRLPRGRYAVLSAALGVYEYGEAWSWLYGTWLPQSGYDPDDTVSFERYPFEATGASSTPIVDICIPVRSP